MEKSGINNREALKLACLHELAHQYLYKTRFLLFENELWIQELAADLLVGAFSVLNGDVATGKYKFVVSRQKATLTHPDGKLREEVVIYGRKYVEKLLQQKRYEGIKDILTGLPAFVYSHYKELQESWDRVSLEDSAKEPVKPTERKPIAEKHRERRRPVDFGGFDDVAGNVLQAGNVNHHHVADKLPVGQDDQAPETVLSLVRDVHTERRKHSVYEQVPDVAKDDSSNQVGQKEN